VAGAEPGAVVSANRACQRHHLHSAGAALPQRGGRRASGSAARVDVVDEADLGRRRTRRRKRSANVPSARLQAEASLALDRTCSPDERCDRQLPDAAELAGERLGRPVPALQRALPVGGNECQHRRCRARQRLGDDRCRLAREPALSVLLPCLHEAPGGSVVDDRRAGACERDPPAAALGAALDRPGAWGATAAAERRRQPDQRVAAAGAECGPGHAASGASVRQQKVEEHSCDRTGTPVTGVSRSRDD
jgi:hypothetical protein